MGKRKGKQMKKEEVEEKSEEGESKFYHKKRFILGVTFIFYASIITVVLLAVRNTFSYMPRITLYRPKLDFSMKNPMLETLADVKARPTTRTRLCYRGSVKVKRCGLLIVDTTLDNLKLHGGFEEEKKRMWRFPILSTVSATDMVADCPPNKYEYEIYYSSIKTF